jgi:DNA-binding protein HU-beta
MATLPTIPASLSATIKKLAEDIVTTGVSVGAILAAIENIAPAIHIGGQYVAWIVAASSIVAAVVAQARRVAGAKILAAKAAKHVPVPVPVVPSPAQGSSAVRLTKIITAVPTPTVKKAVKKAPAKKTAAKKAPAKKAK